MGAAMKRVFILLALLCGLHTSLASAANCFWVGGTATWDGSNFTSWATSSGGTGAGCPGATNVPTSSDVAIFDASSGGGTVTVNATISISSLTTTAFTGTLDFSANNNNVNIGTVTPAANGWADTSGTHTVNMGSGTWTMDANTGIFSWAGVNLTLNANSSTLVVAAKASSSRTFASNAKTFNNVTISGAAGSIINMSGASTYTNLTITNQANVTLATNITVTTMAITSASSTPVVFASNSGIARSVTLTNNFTPSWIALQNITFSGGTNAATSSFDLGGNTGITITAPSSGGGGGKIIGGWLLHCENDNDNIPCFLNKAA